MDFVYSILYPVLSIGGIGLVLGAGLGVAGEVFAVEEDPKYGEIMNALPGANCGGCGFPGCGGFATAVIEGKAPVNGCPVGGAACAAAIAGVMGVDAGSADPIVASVRCNGTCSNAKEKYEYYGISDCNMANQLVAGGSKGCSYGCLGLGSCVKACAFDAIHVIDGVAVVDKDKCVACGKCVPSCPKKLVEIVPAKFKVKMLCSSEDAGKVVMANCSVGCIGCKICEKNCPFDAIHVENNIATIDYAKCKNCGICANKCPKKVITGAKPVVKEEVAKAAPAKEEPAKVEAVKEESTEA